MATDILHIIDGCKVKDRLMQKKLYEHCYKEMMKICYRYVHDTEISAGLYNDAMLKVFSNIGTYQEEGKIMGWIKKIVVNTCIDHVRRKTKLHFEALPENEKTDTAIDNEVLVKMSNIEIRRLINRLPQQAAMVFNLYVYEAYNHAEIAEILHIPEGSSRYYLSEARRLLKLEVTKNIHELNKL